MSLATALCAYCEQLSENAPSHAVRVMRCPLCKTDLGVTAGGAKFRLAEGREVSQPHSHRHAILISVIAASLLFGALIVVLTFFLRARPPVIQPTPNVAAATVPTQATAPNAATQDPSEVVAQYKGQHQPENAIVKPYSRPWRNPPPVKSSPISRKESAQLPAARSHSALRDAPSDLKTERAQATGLQKMLEETPEVALQEPMPGRIAAEEANQRIADLMREIAETNRKEKEPDAFIRQLREKRGDLAGLPFLLGKACRLESSIAAEMTRASRLVRVAASREVKHSGSLHGEPNAIATFWNQWNRASNRPLEPNDIRETPANNANEAQRQAVGVAALTQILTAEEAPTRKSLVASLNAVDHPLATKSLVKIAVFDPDADVRGFAVNALKARAAQSEQLELTQAFRHPFAPASRHAAQAIVRLDLQAAIPSLIDFLSEPDPAAPFQGERNGQPTLLFRETVRINHFRNCQLCHPPIDAADRSVAMQVPGVVPNPAQPLRKSLSGGYSPSLKNRDIIVRADTTYLRQDFSALLPVASAHPWPDVQRFDFLVRTRALTEQEAKDFNDRTRSDASSPQHDAALAALRELTGQDYGRNAEAWRRACLTAPGMLGKNKPGYAQ